jgi:excisionase family DNA binding protein
MSSRSESIPWRQRQVINVPLAAELLGCSRAKVYALQKSGDLTFVLIGGRTLIRVEGLTQLIDKAPMWTPRHRADKARAARLEHSRRRVAALTR